MPTRTLKTPKQWHQCLEAGTAAVRRPHEVRRFERRIGLPHLTLYHLPSFVDCTGWTIYHLPRENSYLLQTVVWRQQEDGKRMEDLMLGRVLTASAEPTLEETTTPLDPVWCERQLAALSTIRLPLLTKRPIGLDGENYGVHVPGQFDLEWWCEGPNEWAELIAWMHQCMEDLRRLAAA